MRLAIFLSLGLAACGTDTPTPDEEVPVNCATETRDDDFAVGLAKVGNTSALNFTLMTADPAPPIRVRSGGRRARPPVPPRAPKTT